MGSPVVAVFFLPNLEFFWEIAYYSLRPVKFAEIRKVFLGITGLREK